jgi:hypothetical protein
MTTAEMTRMSGRLRSKLAPLMAEVSARSQMIAEHPDPRAMYPALLELVYAEIRTTVPLLIAAEHRAVELAAEGDTVAEALVPWLRAHATEEEDHASWLLDDYSRVGGDLDALVARPGAPAIASLVGSVYYWTLHAHPVAILGYCAVLEGSPPSEAFVERIARRSGYPADSFKTLLHHSTLDVLHGGELFELMDELPLLPHHEAVVSMTALQTADLLIAAADDLLDALEIEYPGVQGSLSTRPMTSVQVSV